MLAKGVMAFRCWPRGAWQGKTPEIDLGLLGFYLGLAFMSSFSPSFVFFFFFIFLSFIFFLRMTFFCLCIVVFSLLCFRHHVFLLPVFLLRLRYLQERYKKDHTVLKIFTPQIEKREKGEANNDLWDEILQNEFSEQYKSQIRVPKTRQELCRSLSLCQGHILSRGSSKASCRSM